MLFLLLTLGAASCESHSEVTTLRLGHGLPVSHPVHRAMERMAEGAAERSGGRLRLVLYPAEQLGSERECLELLQIGSLAMTKVSASVMENFAPGFRVFGLPYLFRDEAHRTAVLEGEVGRELLLESQRFRLRGLAYYDAGQRSFYTRDRPVRTPADLQGMKIRTQESASAMALVRQLGAGHAVGQRLHLSVDLVPQAWNARAGRGLRLFGDAMTFLFALAVLGVGGARLVLLTLELGQRTAALRIPLGWIYLVLPLTGLLIMFHAATSFAENRGRA